MNPAEAGQPAQQSFDIRDIVGQNRLVAHFQQIVSVSRKKVNGLEGLIRGVHPETRAIIPPFELFEAAQKSGLTLELDRACREKVLESFGRVCLDDRERLLFLNVDASILDEVAGSDYLFHQVMKHQIHPGNVVIEISEKKVHGNASLIKFVDSYRQHGFMVALDDVGTGFSNMDRILLVKPDIIKLDISLVRNIGTDFYKQGVFKSLVSLSKKIGALVIAEGVETEEEAVQILRLGGHMIQGYYFSVPEAVRDGSRVFENDRIDWLSRRFNDYMNLQYAEERRKSRRRAAEAGRCARRLSEVPEEDYDRALGDIVAGNPEMECAYILDEYGVQISDTVCPDAGGRPRENLIFYSASRGTDHSMERYYYPLVSAKLKKYSTEPYISMATGNLCVTISVLYGGAAKRKRILCVDFVIKDEIQGAELGGPSLPAETEMKPGMLGLISRMSEEMTRDGLTGAYNRRYIEERLMIDVLHAYTERKPLSILLADIDCFKAINDRHGHLAGDQVLREFVHLSKGCIRKNSDWIARYGGDEFLLVLLNADENAAVRVAEKVRTAAENTAAVCNGSEISYTVSIGTFTVQSGQTTSEEFIGEADRNLYQAKNAGRNRTISGSGTAFGAGLLR